MNTATTTRTSKLSVNPSSVNLLRSLAFPETIREDPGQFESALAHEIRNPLSTIKLSAEMLQSMTTNDNQKVFLDIIIRGSMRINDILIDLLVSSRPGEVQNEKHSVHQLLDEVLAMTEDSIMLKHIKVIKNYTAGDCNFFLNKQRMKIALTNIIINAIEAINDEGGELIVGTKISNGKFILQIADNGCGISKTNLKNIFKPYFTNKPGGLGLGLATTGDILCSNHVKVKVKSAEGTGTRFILLFGMKA
jgi:signal transduction histidine kinase